jgi:alpha-amylase/alpha-mannosidase (GH57 family)
MKPLRICFLWHQHQPYYRKESKFILPWVRFHAVKDYLDLPLLLDEFPTLKQTFNIVPSLLLQLIEYTKYGVIDRIQELSLKHPKELTLEEREEILHQFFVCNFQNLIAPYPRYLELYSKVNSGANLNEQDWMDLQVWYNLAWVGQLTRQRQQFQRYFLKGKDFTQKEKEFLLLEQLKIIEEIVPTLSRLYHLGQMELSISPFYHPILPLLCDTGYAKVALPEINLPEPRFRFPEDASRQIEIGKNFFNETFGFIPNGLWPSEGSLSTEVLDIILQQGFKWTATDSKLLYKTIGEENPLLQYFPFVYEKDSQRLVIFFRDSHLSDSIGFRYQQWREEDAVADFVNILKDIRSRLVNAFGEDCLDYACVPIILDGENCWEYYKENGLRFLRMLYKTINETPEISTFTFSEIVETIQEEYPHLLKGIYPGSWINANFYTWIGQPQKQTAWLWLTKARKLVESKKENTELYQKAMELVMIAEGSDWFWWYGDDNIAPNKEDFDKLFRWYLAKIYETLGEKPPEEILNPEGMLRTISLLTPPSKLLTDQNKNKLSIELGWGMYYAKSAIGTMHTNQNFISEIYFGNTRNMFLIGIRFLRKLSENDKVIVYFTNPLEFKIVLSAKEFSLNSAKTIEAKNIYFFFSDYFVVGVDLGVFFDEKANFSNSILEFNVKSENELGEMSFPIEGVFTYIVI